MSSSRPFPPPPSMPALDLELTVVSAKHLKNVNWRHGDLKPYAVAYLDPGCEAVINPDVSRSTKPVWNERLTLPIPNSSPSLLLLTIDIFHSDPSCSTRLVVGTARSPLKDLIGPGGLAVSAISGASFVRTLELRRPSGRPQGKLRLELTVRESRTRSTPPPSGYYSSSPPPPFVPYHGHSHPYYSSGAGYYSASAPYYYVPPSAAYGAAPSAPVDYSSGYTSYEQTPKGGRIETSGFCLDVGPPKGGRMETSGLCLDAGPMAGAFRGLSLGEGLKQQEDGFTDSIEIVPSANDHRQYRF